MADIDKPAVVDMRWLAEGREDKFKHYLDRTREDLPLSSWSDEELGGYAFMNYNRSDDDEVAVILAFAQGGIGTHRHASKIMFMTAIKERLRWLSRRLAVVEGRYPGIKSPLQEKEEQLEKIRQYLGVHGAEGDHSTHNLLRELGYPVPTDEELREWEVKRRAYKQAQKDLYGPSTGEKETPKPIIHEALARTDSTLSTLLDNQEFYFNDYFYVDKISGEPFPGNAPKLGSGFYQFSPKGREYIRFYSSQWADVLGNWVMIVLGAKDLDRMYIFKDGYFHSHCQDKTVSAWLDNTIYKEANVADKPPKQLFLAAPTIAVAKKG